VNAPDRPAIVDSEFPRVCEETGEEFFAPETVDRLQKIILTGKTPKRTIETPIFEFAA
jgi:hypothetical protein